MDDKNVLRLMTPRSGPKTSSSGTNNDQLPSLALSEGVIMRVINMQPARQSLEAAEQANDENVPRPPSDVLTPMHSDDLGELSSDP